MNADEHKCIRSEDSWLSHDPLYAPTVFGKQDGVCQLCLNERQLCESHIVSQFCYDTSVDIERFFIQADGTNIARKNLQKQGQREYLLCKDCEGRFGHCYENVIAPYWKTNISEKGPYRVGQRVSLKCVPYHAMKHFVLSVFWRMSVSEVYGQIIWLGPYGEKLRDILYNDKPIGQLEYPLWGNLIADNGGRLFWGVTHPEERRFDHCHLYTSCFGGCEWTVAMVDHLVSRNLHALSYSLTENGNMDLEVRHFSQNACIRKLGPQLVDGLEQ